MKRAGVDRTDACRDFAAWSDRMEKRLIKLLVVLLVALAVSQTTLRIPAFRSWLTATDKWEGIPFRKEAPSA